MKLPGIVEPENFREHVAADVANWPEALAASWQELVATANNKAWLKYSAHEVEMRAWLQLRSPLAREPVVLNRHHLCPSAPQEAGSWKWPPQALYCGRAPMSARRDDPAWRHAFLLGNPYSRDLFPDALERYRIDLRQWLRQDKEAAVLLAANPRCGARRSPRVDAIRDLTPDCALVCSCVSSPWTPPITVRPNDPLPPSIRCHCHLIVMAWRAMRAPAVGATRN